jgi:hypothetical protein
VISLKKCSLFAVAIYCAGVILYSVHPNTLFPFLGGWLSGLTFMGGLSHHALRDTS